MRCVLRLANKRTQETHCSCPLTSYIQLKITPMFPTRTHLLAIKNYNFIIDQFYHLIRTFDSYMRI